MTKAGRARRPSWPGPGRVPLARALSKMGLASRADAIALVLEGRVTVNGAVARDPGTPVVPEAIDVAIEGRAVEVPRWRAIALHKPRGVVTTRRDPQGRPTVGDLLDEIGHGLQPVGRLDIASTGLLICTNDSRLAAWLTSPESGVAKEYVVTVRGRVEDVALIRLREGVRDRGDVLRPEAVRMLKRSARETHLAVVLTEGKNREIRRLFTSVGHEVTRVLRVRIGGLELGDLGPGQWREVPPRLVSRYFPRYTVRRSRLPGRPTST